MNVLLNAFLQGLLVGAIIASITVIIYLLYIKLKKLHPSQDTES
jgi:hypothetical protein